MEPEEYTLILTRGAHSIHRDAAMEIRRAIAAGEAVVNVELDPYGGPGSSRRTDVVTAHVMAIAEPRPRRIVDENFANVRVLRPKRRG